MAKPKTRYMCQACGSEQSRWQGQCPDCAEWNTLVQENAVVSVFSARHDLSSGGRAVELVGLDAEIALPERIKTGIAEFDRAIGGGIVPGSAMLYSLRYAAPSTSTINRRSPASSLTMGPQSFHLRYYSTSAPPL